MFKILLIILIIKNVLGDDESYEKYIDLLPEEEKQDFLDRIARRILEGIKTEKLDEPNQSNVEITDAQLDAQDAYVQDILKEETERFEDDKRQEAFLRDQEGGENGDENKYIDLTLREGKILERKIAEQDIEPETTSEIPLNVIPVKLLYDDPNDDPNNHHMETLNEDLKETSSTRIKHEIKDSSNISINESNNDSTVLKDDSVPQPLNDTKNELNLRKSFKNYLSTVNTSTPIDTSTDFDQNLDKSSVVTEDNGENSESTTQTEENMNNLTTDTVLETTYIYSNERGLKKEVYTENQNTETTAKDSNVANTISTIEHSSLNKEEGKDGYESTMFTIKVNEITQNNENKVNQKFQRSGDEESIGTTHTPIIYINVTNTKTTDKLSINVINISKVNESDDNIKYSEITKNKIKPEVRNSNSNLTAVINKNVKNGTQKTEENASEEKSTMGLHLRSNLNKSKEDIIWIDKLDPKPKKEYEVFEVDAEKPPYQLLNKDKTIEQLRYVPIYDYSPENAYFRPYDRFGSDFRDIEKENLENFGDEDRLKDDENDFDVNTPSFRSRFSGYNNKENKQYRIRNINYPIKNGNSKMFGFLKPVKTHFVNNFYNPNDYFDMDYANNGRYILRSVYEPNDKLLPDSNESDHPYNSIYKSDSVKDHIRAVRKLLYLQKRFGYVPEIDKEMRKFDQRSKNIKYPTKKAKEEMFNKPNEKISVDYYYERADSREDFRNAKAVRENSSQDEIFTVPGTELIGEFDVILNKKNKGHSSSINSVKREIIEERKFGSFFDAMLNVLADMVRFDNEALEGYDWLRTSVDIQSAIRKLLDLTDSLKYGKTIHPKDLDLLKYCLYLFKSSKVSLHEFGRENKIEPRLKRRKKKGLLPKNLKKNRNKQSFGRILWKDFAKYIRNDAESKQKLRIIYDFEDFLQLVLYHLNEFHDAIKHIAMITKFDNQKWFPDLKLIYFKEASRKRLGEVLLHLSLLKLLDLLEADAVNLSEVNFRLFVENNSEAVRRTKKEFVFVLRVLEELNRINV